MITFIPPITRRNFLSLPPASLCALYDTYATHYESLDGTTLLTRILGLDAARRELLSNARGDVLETGAGTGLNRRFYPPLKSYTGLDESEEMLKVARSRGEGWVMGDVENIPWREGTFDTVVDTFSLCVYRNPVRALGEMRRVVREGGTVLLLEHTVSHNWLVRWYQDVTSDASASLSKGCVGNQRVQDLCSQVGFTIVKRKYYVGGTVVALHLTT